MKNKKQTIFTIIIIAFLILFTFFCYTTSKLKNEINTNKLDYTAVSGATTYYDWSAASSGPLNKGYLEPEYSYSTLFFTDKTKFTVIKNSGDLTWQTTEDGIKLPYFNNIKSGEVVFLVTNCAVNENGELLDVLFKVTNVNVWSSDSYLWIRAYKYFNLLKSQNSPVADYDYRVSLGVGTPISFLLHTEGEGGDCEIIMKYYKAGTYNSSTDKGTAGNITNVIGYFTDIDVLSGSNSHSSEFLTGLEGFAPNTGKSYIYYNKNEKKVTNSDKWHVTLKPLQNGITVKSATTTDVNAHWYQSSAFIATKDISNSTYRFKYGGKGCGMWYMFVSPYPYEMEPPIKSSTAKETTPNHSYTYKISQYIPNNYYGSLLNFSEVYDQLIDDTLFSSFVISDTFDSSLTIDTTNIKVTDESGNNRTTWFNINTSGNTVKATAKNTYYNKSNFYNHMYTLNVPVTTKSSVKKATLTNKATVSTKLGTNESETYNSNEVSVKVYYYITVKHLAEGTKEVLAPEEKIKKYYNESYTANKSTGIPSYYEYSSRTSNYTGTATSNVTVTYYYKLKKGTLTVNHLEQGTNKVLAPQTVDTLEYTKSYSTEASSTALKTHDLVSTPTNAKGTFNGNTIVNYYYKKKSATLTVKYLEDQTNKVLAPTKTSTVYYTDTYETSHSSSVPSNYELLKIVGDYKGTVNTKTIEVIYYYQKKDSSLETSISKVGPEEITKKDEPTKYTITYNAKVADYIGNGTITIIDTLPYHIDQEKSDIAEGIYDSESNTITWTIPWNGIDSYNNKGSITITKSISLVYSDLLPTERIMINSVKGSIKLDNNSRDIEDQSSTKIKVPGTITVHHYVKGTKIELIPDTTHTDLVGELFSTTALKKDGYIVYKPETESYTFAEEPQEIIYEYEKIKLKITTIVDGGGGTITGDEEVEYGSDSTKDKIVITPEEGYVLGTVKINGQEIELTEEEKEKLVLNNIVNITKDMEIHVTFIKDSGVNAETGSFANFIYALAFVLIIIIGYLKIKKSKIIKI